MPTIIVSRTRKAIMYSLTWLCTFVQLATMHSTVNRVDSSTKNSEMPSMPMW